VQLTEPNRPPLLPLVISLCGLILLFHVGSALAGRSLFRASHLGTALGYADGPINLFRPKIVGFNATETPTALEFPIWQATAALILKATHSRWYGWANLVSLGFFATCLWPFFQIARELVGERAAWWALLFFLAAPLIMISAGEAATDGFCLTTTIWFVFFADKLIRTGKAGWWFPATLFATLAAVSKLPFFMAAGLYTVFLLKSHSGWKWRPWVLLASSGAIAALVLALWTRYTDSLSAQALYPFFELRLSHSPGIVYWWFGDLHYRLSPGPWIKGGWRFLHGTLGSLPLGLVLIAGLLRPGNRLAKLWLAATFLTILVFTHVVLVHWHYYLMCCPAVALLCGAMVAEWEDIWLRHTTFPQMVYAVAGIALVLAPIEGITTMKIALNYDRYPAEMAALIREHTKPTDRLIVYTEDSIWGGEELFRSGRKGLRVAYLESLDIDPAVKGLRDLLGSESDLNRLRSLGYNKLVLISESPVRFAAEATNPGRTRRRHLYPAHVSATVDSWPVVYRSDDLLIQEIP
jgi:hypothetical protein